LRREVSAAQGRSTRRHGHRSGKETPEYKSWRSLRDRCGNPRNKQWKDYGGRGITVCRRWSKFENFLADMGERPSMKHTIERKNNERGYSKSNCRWATMREQQRNRRSTRFISFRGERKCLKDWADAYGVPYATFKWRIAQGWVMARALGLVLG
jgi:hypothetical protein